MPWPALEHWSTALSQARYSFSSRRRRGARSVLHTQPAQLALPGRPPATSSLCRCCRAKPPPALAAPSLVLTLLGRACPLLPPPSGFCRSWTPAGLSVAVSRYPRAIPPPPAQAAQPLALAMLGHTCRLPPPLVGLCRYWAPVGSSRAVGRCCRATPPPPRPNGTVAHPPPGRSDLPPFLAPSLWGFAWVDCAMKRFKEALSGLDISDQVTKEKLAP